MQLHEYQSKYRFAEFGIPISRGKVAHSSQQAYAFARELGGTVAVKAQVLAGGRGDAGGIKIAHTPEEARSHAETILGMKIQGLTVHQVLIDPVFTPTLELYLGIMYDRTTRKPVIIASAQGRDGVSGIARENPGGIIRESIDPLLGLHDFQTRSLAIGVNLPRELWQPFGAIAHDLYRCYAKSDALLAEINPLIITSNNQLIALDGKMIIDDNALFRHKDLSAMRDFTTETEAQTQAREAGISYVKLNGQIGCLVNGAGLAMTTMDIISLYGENEFCPANFLDVGGGAKADKVTAALRILLSDANVKSVLVNIFGGITRCDEVAAGILQAYAGVNSDLPMVVRLQGTSAHEGRQMIEDAGIPRLSTATTLSEAARKAISAARGALAYGDPR